MPLSQIKASQKFPRNPQKKPLYSLEHTPSENFLYDCQCCGICGTKTQEAIKQLMTYGEESKVYGPGKWKTEVKTKLCFPCQKLFKSLTDSDFERYKQKQNIDGLQTKKHKSYEINRTLPQDMEVNGSPTAFYNQTSAAICTLHSNTHNNSNDMVFNHLPPNQVLPNVAEFYHTQTKDRVKILGETPYFLPICDVQENNSFRQSFTLESDSIPITREDPSLQSINEQKILLSSQSFEPSWPSCDQLTLQTLYPLEEDVTNVQETPINFPLHNSEDQLQFEPDIELNPRYNEDTTAQSFETSQANNQNYWSYPIEEVMESNNLARHYDHHIPENYNVPQTFVIYEIGQVEREGIQRFDYNLQ
uniref:Uncharacterized protein n=1 Tax=Panagrolaimus sp. ES5 TaxID=591445 RepID=A0AC34FAG0_9BILA